MKSPIILKIFKNNQLLEVKQFEEGQIIFGHDADVTVDLNDESISAIHSLIELRDSGYFVCDMGSASGTKKNGKPVMDESISSGDQIEMGPFRIQFFVGAPKPKGSPVVSLPNAPLEPAPKEETSVGKAEPVVSVPPVVKSKPPQLPKASLPQGGVEQPRSVRGAKEISGNVATFAPPSEIQDLRSYLKPTKGPVVEVIVAWKERILSTYHFGSDSNVTIGSGKNATVQIPSQFMAGTASFLDLKGGCKVLAPIEAQVSLVNSVQTTLTAEDLQRSGKVMKVGSANAIRLDQGELLCLAIDGGTLQIFVRYVPNTNKPLLSTPLDFSAGEFTGLVIALVIVSLTALYMSVYQPSPLEDKKEEEIHMAKVIFDEAPKPPPPPPPPQEKVEVPPPPPPELKKIKVTEEKKPAPRKEKPAEQERPKQVQAAKAQEVRPIPSKVVRPKKFTSTQQGGSVAVGKVAGANAESAKDVNKMGLLSAFGGGGVRKQLDQAYSGSGELLGMADKATGTSGQSDNRAGDDIGSQFKDTGAGGKGTATQGIADVGTKGRASGMNSYGSGLGMGGKGNVTIDAGGVDANWDGGTIDREAVRRVIRSILNQIRSCYERQLRANSRLEGKIVIQFEIVEQGRVRSSKPLSSSMRDATVESCVAQRIREARFPEPPPGTIAVVDYPFLFGAQK